MKTVIEMACEAGLRSAVLLRLYGKPEALCESELEELEQIKHFAELVRADERQPLTTNEIAKALALAGLKSEDYREDGQIEPLVRAIETAHGIKEKNLG